jgi:serine/threonine protein kinase
MSIPKIANDGYCKLSTGYKIDKYTIGEKLGAGRFSTVWSVSSDDGEKFALKVYRSGDHDQRYYINEIRMLNIISKYREDANIDTLVEYHGTFAHTMIGDDFCPKIHPCVKFQLAGDHLGRYLRAGAFTTEVTKSIMKQVLQSISFLHARNIIHTDIKPENIFVTSVEYDDATVEKYNASFTSETPKRKLITPFIKNIKVVLGDLGTSTWADSLFSKSVGTVPYLSPELVVDAPYTVAIDIWASSCMCFELLCNNLLFDVYTETDITYNGDISYYSGSQSDSDTEFSVDAVTNATSNAATSVASGTSISASSDAESYDLAYRHLKIMEKVLGHPPSSFTKANREFYNSKGKLIGNPELSPVAISNILVTQFNIAIDDAHAAEQFILQGLKYEPSARKSAQDMLLHKWLI